MEIHSNDRPQWKALVVDGNALMRLALVSLVNKHAGVRVISEAASAREARSLCTEVKPDLIVLDIDVPDADGIDLLRELRALHPEHAVLVVSAYEDMQSVQRVFAAGARAYVSKLDDIKDMLTAIGRVMEGQMFMGSRISQQMLEAMGGAAHNRCGNRLSQLSNRELHVFRLLGHGKGATEIARELTVSVKTVETHQQRIKEKLNLKSAESLRGVAKGWCADLKIQRGPALAPVLDPKPARKESSFRVIRSRPGGRKEAEAKLHSQPA